MSRYPPLPSRPVATPLTCVYCGDEIVIAAQFLPTGAVCADCGPNAEVPTEPAAPTNENPEKGLGTEARPDAVISPPQSEEGVVRDSEGRVPEPGAVKLDVEVEEWVYFDLDHDVSQAKLLATPRAVHVVNLKAARALKRFGGLCSAFHVVLEWCSSSDQEIPFQDVLAVFWISAERDRAEALNQARTIAVSEARRLKAVGPFGYRTAREINV